MRWTPDTKLWLHAVLFFKNAQLWSLLFSSLSSPILFASPAIAAISLFVWYLKRRARDTQTQKKEKKKKKYFFEYLLRATAMPPPTQRGGIHHQGC
ncbi:hypothetical protein J3F84DRAFT_171347 [Trichoderma pleuroticola]